MMTKLDINLLALARQAGKDQPGLPGFYAVTPPRRTARGRAEDYLIVLLSCTGGAPFPTNLQEQWFGQISQAYYRTPGSTTAAMRAAAQTLNQLLFDRAIRGAGTRQGLGLLTLVVVRDEQIFLAQCGPLHAFVITPNRLDHYSDPETAGNGLGVARTTAIRFFQSRIRPNEYVLITHQLPPGWDDPSLQATYTQDLESQRRRLLNAAGSEASAVLIQTQAGHGRMRLLKPKPSPPPATAESPVPAATPAVTAPPIPTETPAVTTPSVPAATDILITPPPAVTPTPQAVVPAAAPASGAEAPSEQPPTTTLPPITTEEEAITAPESTQPAAAPLPTQPAPASGSTVPSSKLTPTASRQLSSTSVASPASRMRRLNDRTPSKPIQPRKTFLLGFAVLLRKAVSGVGRILGRAGRAVGRGLRLIIKRLLPDEGLFHLPPSTMIFFAVAVPVIIAIVGGTMYLERGRTLQYQSHYDQAFNLAMEAGKLQNPAQQRAAWGLVLIDLDAAEDFRSTADSKALRLQAQQALDQIEHITRIDLQPAIRDGLDKSVQVSRIVATNEDLYLLNGARGNVMRALYTPQGYEVDPNFHCGKGTYEAIVVGPPVGIVSMPKGNTHQADILGLDENGNRMYCGTDSKLPAAESITLPEGWNKPSAITLNPDNMNLYVLDIPAKQVWIYQDVEEAKKVMPFFEEPQTTLTDVIDIAAASGDLFVLHADGQVSRCIYGTTKDIHPHCDPVPFTGLPGGRADGATMEGTQFWQMAYATPGPSFYLLDATSQAILHFSLLGNFQNQYRSKNPLPAKPAIALAISPRRSVFIAVGNQIYYTPLP
jgi:hypothetical protein